ncbi:hypothetical protein NL50_07190 [Clostridium acetobutylicum]|nr:hypothetical protein NL50_07190 [Clostridium acetobutylicum]
MDISQILQSMQTSGLQGISGTKVSSNSNDALFKMLLDNVIEKQTDKGTSAVNTSSTQKTGTSETSAAKELELMLQLQALQSMSSSYSSVDSASDDSSSSDSTTSSFGGNNNYAYQILNSLSGTANGSTDSSSLSQTNGIDSLI